MTSTSQMQARRRRVVRDAPVDTPCPNAHPHPARLRRASFWVAASVALLNVALSAGPLSHAYAEPPKPSALRVTDAYVRQPPPGQTNGVAFMVIASADGKAHEIVGASSPAAKHTALHTHSHEKGVMRMTALKSLTIPAKGSVALKPGGHHVMLMGLKRKLKPGDVVTIELNMKDGTKQTVRAKVRGLSG